MFFFISIYSFNCCSLLFNKNLENPFFNCETVVSDAVSACFPLVSKLPDGNPAAPPSIPVGFHT